MRKTAFLFIMASLVALSSGYAQKFKYGFLNSDALLTGMPEMKQADSLLQTYVAQLEAQVQMMVAEYQQKFNEYQTNEASLSPLVKETKLQNLTDLEKRIQEFQIKAQEDIQKQRTALYSPIIQKFNKAVAEVAKENEYKFIIDNSNNVLLYYEDADDVAPLVKRKLGM